MQRAYLEEEEEEEPEKEREESETQRLHTTLPNFESSDIRPFGCFSV